jgi:hypothetical protein
MSEHMRRVRGSYSWALFLLALSTLPFCDCAQAQNIEGQIVAAQFGEFQVSAVGNGFQFPPATCQVSGGGRNFNAFAMGAPIKIVDSDPNLTEIAAPVAVFIDSCAVSLPTVHSHESFYLTSGTGGLQEAITNGIDRGGNPNTIILNAEWYTLVAPSSPSAVIASVHGNTTLGLVDVTTTPYTSYTWNGSNYVATSAGGGATTPATTALLKGSGSANGVVAATPGTDFITPNPGGTGQIIAETGAAVLGVTNLNNNFYVSGFPSNGCTVNSITYTTQLECAWWTAKAYAEANTAMVTLYMGYGYYNINASLVLPTQSFTSVSLIGAGYQGSTIVANATMADAMIYKNETAGGGTLPNATFRDFKMIANDKAQGCMRLWGLQEPVIENVNCDNVPNGAPFLYQFGEPSNYGQGWIFQLMGKNIIGGNSVHYASVAPVITVNTNGGGAPTFNVVSGGSGYSTSAEQILLVNMLGNQNGTSDQPCAVMPTNLTATLSGTSIATITGTGGSGCTGTINVQIIPVSNIAVGVDDWASDSTLDDIEPGGTLIGIIQHSGDTTYKHAHPTGTVIGIQNAGGTNNIYKDIEIDTNYKWGFDMQGGANSSVIEGTHSYGNNGASFAMFHLASNATVQFGPQSSLCVAPYVALSDWHEFSMPYGTFETAGYLPAGTSVAPNDTVCSNLGSIFMQPVTIGGPGHTSPLLVNGNAAVTGTSTLGPTFTGTLQTSGTLNAGPVGTATALANFASNALVASDSYWTGSAPTYTTFGWNIAPGSGSNPFTYAYLGFGNCPSGGCQLQIQPNVYFVGSVQFSSPTQFPGSTLIDANGLVGAPSYAVTGTTFAATGCGTVTSRLGGATAGSFHSATSGTCTVVVTMGNSVTAANGFACGRPNDLTTNSDSSSWSQTATSTTTATLSGTSVAGDVISFACTPY